MALSKKAKLRLGTLVDYMATLPKAADQHFDMEQWARHPGGFSKHGFEPNTVLPRDAPNLCGTTACALGWACTVPSFYRAGLRLKTSDLAYSDHAFPTFNGHMAEDAAEVFFDINQSQMNALFFASSIKTPKAWAKRARELIKDWAAK